MIKVLVDPTALEEAAKWLEIHSSSSGSAEAFAADALRESIAQPAEVECVEIIGYVNPENIERMKHGELCGYMIEAKEDKRRSCAVMTVESHLAALSAVTAERDRLMDQVKVLQSDANSWQSGYDKGRRDGTKHRQSEVDKLRAEAEAMRPIHTMILNALDRDAEEGKAARGEMAAELRAAMSAKEA